MTIKRYTANGYRCGALSLVTPALADSTALARAFQSAGIPGAMPRLFEAERNLQTEPPAGAPGCSTRRRSLGGIATGTKVARIW
jgi:hypothetical protein